MRRKLSNKKSIFLIIIVAIFTLFSYFFDQSIIRKEDTLRNVQIKFENLNTEISSLKSISDQLTGVSEFISEKQIYFYRYRNHFLKNVLLLTNYDEYPNLTDKKLIDALIEDEDREFLIKARLIENYLDVLETFENLNETLRLIYGWHLDDYFKKYDDGDFYKGPDINEQKLFNDNLDLFKEKNIKIYYDNLLDAIMDDQIKKIVSDFKLYNWLDLHKFNYILINQFEDIKKTVVEDSYYIDDLQVKKEDLRYKVIEDIKNISSKKNIYVLASIISQILSLLFLLLLFRFLLNR